MRINIWIVLAVLLALLAVTRLSQYQHETQRICADDPSAHLASEHDQLTSERGVLSLKPADRPERRNQQP